MPNSINGNQGEKTGDCHSAGSEDELAQTATMLETWAPECFPEVNEHGQVHFVRAMMESAAKTIRAYIATRADAAIEACGVNDLKRQLAEARAERDSLFDAIGEKDGSEETTFARKWLEAKTSLVASQAREKIWSDAVAAGRSRRGTMEAETVALRAQLAEADAGRDEAIADARQIAETNLHAQAYIDGQKLGVEVLRARVEALTEALREARGQLALEAGEAGWAHPTLARIDSLLK